MAQGNDDPLAQRAQTMATPLSYLRPVDPTGQAYTKSYTAYQNAPGNSYTNPHYGLFNDRRPAQQPIRSTLKPAGGTAATTF